MRSLLALTDLLLAALLLGLAWYEQRGIACIEVDCSPLSSPEGRLAEDRSADELHSAIPGYRHLARWILTDGGPVGQLLAP